MNRARTLVLLVTVLITALSRLMPHPPNVTAVGAIALFGGACFADRRAAFLVPLTALCLSDLVLGPHDLMLVVYASVMVNVLLGRWLRHRRTAVPIVTATLLGSLQFFVVTNFACWLLFYPNTAAGLAACYTAAIPFFHHTLLGDVVFATALFSSLAIVERGFPSLRESASATVA